VLFAFDPRDDDRLREILRGENPGASQEVELLIDGEPYTDQALDWTVGRPESERPGMVLSSSFGGYLPTGLKNRPVTYDVITEGIRIRRFTGHALRPASGRAVSELTAASGGFWLDKTCLDEDVVVAGARPDQVILDALTRSPRYDKLQLDVETIETPKISRQGDQKFRRFDYPADMLVAATEEVEVVIADTAYNGSRVRLARGPAEVQEPVWTFYVGRDIDPDDFAPAPASEEYSDVIVYRDVDGVQTVLASVVVADSEAPPATYYLIESSEEGDDYFLGAWQRASMVAQRLSRGEREQRVPLAYIHPLLEDGDVVAIVHEYERRLTAATSVGVIETWFAEIRTQSETRNLTHELDLIMVLAHEEVLAPPKVDPLPAPRTLAAPAAV
jgi:hypothetical protein